MCCVVCVMSTVNIFPREILRWIQSLDLALSVKNVKRDFSNGFLVAEIVSRYYGKEVQMHSYDNGTSVKVKKDNWAQLLKTFRKIGIADMVTEDEIGRVLRCEDGAAVSFVTKLYETLTHRKIQTTVKPPTLVKPAYARETGSWKVREALKSVDDNSDLLLQSRLAQETMSVHDKSVHEERSLDPDRFSTTSIAGRSNQITPSLRHDEVSDGPQVRVKEIQVKQLDRNVTHLRASKQMHQQQNQSPTNSPSNKQIRSVTPSGSHGEGFSFDKKYGNANTGGAGLIPENSLSLLNSCISRVISPRNISTWTNSLDYVGNFLAALDEVRVNGVGTEIDVVLAKSLEEIRHSSANLADACIITPKQFWIVSDLFTTAILASPYKAYSYQAAIEGFVSFGKAVTQRDPRSSINLFCDFALFKLARTLVDHPYKRLGILKILYAFSPENTVSHIQCIKHLQVVISDIKVIIHCLTILATYENKVDISLLDMYMYYATIGLGMQSPRLRAGAVAVISTLYNQAGEIVSPMLPQLSALAEQETWWEIQAHLLTLAGHVLQAHCPDGLEISDRDNDSLSLDEECALNIVYRLFRQNSNKNIRIWGVFAVAPGVGHDDKLANHYLDVLLTVSSNDRRKLLGLYNESTDVCITLPSSSGIDFEVRNVLALWNPMAVARAIESKVISEKLERLDSGLMEILHSCVKGGADLGSPESLHKPISTSSAGSEVFETTLNGKWVELFNSLKDFILVGLCDPECTQDAASIIAFYVLKSPLQDSVLLDNKLLGALRLLYPVDGTGHAGCQATAESLLRQIFYFSEYFGAVVINAIEIFSKNFLTNYEMSNLPTLLREFSSK